MRIRLPFLTALALLAVPGTLIPQQQDPPHWSLQQVLRIGAVDGADALGYVGTILVTPQTGDIYVTERGNRIRQYSGEGRPLRTFGGQGSGPGLFESLGEVFWLDGNLVVIDGATGRATRFTADARLIDSRPIESAQDPGMPRGPTLKAAIANGGFVGTLSPIDPTAREPSSLVLMDGSGTDRTLDQLHYQGLWVQLSGRIFFPVPLLPRSVYAVHPYGESLVVVHQTIPSRPVGSFRVRKVNSTGRVIFARNYDYEAVAAPSEFVEQFVTSRPQTVLNFSVDEAIRRIRAVGVTKYFPPVTRVFLGADGSVWLRREAPQDYGVGREAQEDTPVVWWVLNPEGDLVGRIVLPYGQRLIFADSEYVWGVINGELDVPYLVKHRIIR